MAKTNYQIILAAARSIREEGKLYSFGSTRIPNPLCDTPGCAIGWIGFHKNGGMFKPGGEFMPLEVHPVLGISDDLFYERMHGINGSLGHMFGAWMGKNEVCADCLEEYARMYHAPRRAN